MRHPQEMGVAEDRLFLYNLAGVKIRQVTLEFDKINKYSVVSL